MENYYTLEVAGVTRNLPIIRISNDLAIASFVILGDCELVTKAAPLLAERLPQVDYIVTAEAKGIPLVHELSRLMGLPYYIVARKSIKPYMEKPLTDEVVSITTQKKQTLCLDGKDAMLLTGKPFAAVAAAIVINGIGMALYAIFMVYLNLFETFAYESQAPFEKLWYLCPLYYMVDFLNERWKGMSPVAWGESLRESQFSAWVYEGNCQLGNNKKEVKP